MSVRWIQILYTGHKDWKQLAGFLSTITQSSKQHILKHDIWFVHALLCHGIDLLIKKVWTLTIVYFVTPIFILCGYYNVLKWKQWVCSTSLSLSLRSLDGKPSGTSGSSPLLGRSHGKCCLCLDSMEWSRMAATGRAGQRSHTRPSSGSPGSRANHRPGKLRSLRGSQGKETRRLGT